MAAGLLGSRVMYFIADVIRHHRSRWGLDEVGGLQVDSYLSWQLFLRNRRYHLTTALHWTYLTTSTHLLAYGLMYFWHCPLAHPSRDLRCYCY